jgi:hypothetical protein
MPQTIACPHCTQALAVPDDASGKPMRCPRCQKPFAVRLGPAAPAPPPRPVQPAPPPPPAPAGNGGQRRCPTCKAEVPAGARACLDCGTPLPAPVAANSPAIAPAPAWSAPPPPAPVPAGGWVAPPVPAPAPMPAPPPVPAAEAPSGQRSPWLRLAPAALLALVLVGLFVRDWTRPNEPAVTTPKKAKLPPPEIDKDPRVALVYKESQFQFGLVTLKEKDDKGNPKKLTFMANPPGGVADQVNHTSSPAVRIDGKAFLPGERVIDSHRLPGRRAEPAVQLPKNDNGEHEGQRWTWLWDSQRIRLTQTVEIIAGQPDPISRKRLLDTCLVQLTLKNEDDKPHRVGLRFLLDTYIGANDGVPFYVPRKDSPLIQTQEDFTRTIPDYVQALEFPKLDKPGTVAQVALKVGGGLEPPSRVSLTHWVLLQVNTSSGELVTYDIPMADIRGNPSSSNQMEKNPDSAVVLYWDDKELEPGKERTLGFAYGLGRIATGAGGKLGVTTPNKTEAGEAFPLTAYISDPAAGQTVEVVLPEDMELVEGSARQAVPPAEGGRPSSVTWRVKADKPGTYEISVLSGTAQESIQVTVTEPPRSSIFK